MSRFETILLPTDFSENSGHALSMASSIASRTGAHVRLLHAYHLPLEVIAPISGEYHEQLRRMAVTRLEVLQEELAKREISASVEAIDRPPLDAISDATRRHDPDLIVMGNRGHTALQELFLGSVADRTVRTAPCPVLTVGSKWAPERSIDTIVVAMDFSDAAGRALELAKQFALEVGPAKLILVHAHFVPPHIESLFAEQGTPLPEASLQPVAERLEPIILELQDAGIVSEYVFKPRSPEWLITEVAAQQKADMIAIGTHGRSGLPRLLLGSVSERVLQRSPCPVLTVGPPASEEGT